MKVELIIALVTMVLWVVMISYSKIWIGTKLGDILVIVIGMTSLYGAITITTSLYEWAVK